MKNEIVLYPINDSEERIEVQIENDTVWLTQQQMALLFNNTKQNISLHINNCFKEKELDKNSTVKESLIVQQEGNRIIKRKVLYYNLDVIISVGYRVKSQRGTQFRIWATNVLREHLLKGYTLNLRMNRIEDKVESLSKQVNQIDLQIKSNQLPQKGIFFDGQIFDAWVFISDLIKSAEKEIILIDNYIDETVLMLLNKRKECVDACIYTKKISQLLALDLEKHNSQYPSITVKVFKDSHDRFMIIDQKELYHIGASLKDLGKKWFAFTKLDKDILDMIIHKLKEM